MVLSSRLLKMGDASHCGSFISGSKMASPNTKSRFINTEADEVFRAFKIFFINHSLTQAFITYNTLSMLEPPIVGRKVYSFGKNKMKFPFIKAFIIFPSGDFRAVRAKVET